MSAPSLIPPVPGARARSVATPMTAPKGADMSKAEELAWENEGGRLRPAPPDGDTGTPETSAPLQVAITDTAPS